MSDEETFAKAKKFFSESRFIPYGKGGGFDTFATCLSFINDKVQDAVGAAKAALQDTSVVPWGRQPVDKDGKRLKNEDGSLVTNFESVANSLSVTNGAALNARDASQEAVEILKRIEKKLSS